MEDGSTEFSRLGKCELGRHAFEDRMPDRIAAILDAESSSNSLPGVIPKLAQLLRHDRNVEVAYLCHDAAVQVYKLSDEGGHFCGYRNLQMLCLALGHARSAQAGCLVAKQKLTIPQLQLMIENAWDKGFNAHGRTLTGGIQGTRKHIGTSEAEALLLSLDIPCTGTAFQGAHAWRQLLDFVEAYFATSAARDASKTSINITARPPIFLQRPNHSLTIVGMERARSGKRYLLVFDPAWRPASAMRGPLKEAECSGWSAQWVLRQYRKGKRYLKRYDRFETLTVDEV